MSLSAAEQSLLGAFFHGKAAEIDKLGVLPDHCQTDDGKRIVDACLGVHRQGLVVNHLNVMATARGVNPSVWPSVIQIASNGYGDVSATTAVTALKSDYLRRRGGDVCTRLDEALKNRTANVKQALIETQNSIDAILAGHEEKSAKPSDILSERAPTTMFESVSPLFRKLMQRGYMAGMFMLYVSPSGNGKSTVLYTHAVDCLLQQKYVSFITNERSRRYTMDRILRGLTGLSEQEITECKGSNEERDRIYREWVGFCDEYIRVYDEEKYSESQIRRTVKIDKAPVLFIDYMKGDQNDSSHINSMAEFLNSLANSEGISVISAGQMAEVHKNSFVKSDTYKTQAMYGSSVPYHRSTYYIGCKRHNMFMNVEFFSVWKSTFTNEVDYHVNIPFDTQKFIYALDSADLIGV